MANAATGGQRSASRAGANSLLPPPSGHDQGECEEDDPADDSSDYGSAHVPAERERSQKPGDGEGPPAQDGPLQLGVRARRRHISTMPRKPLRMPARGGIRHADLEIARGPPRRTAVAWPAGHRAEDRHI